MMFEVKLDSEESVIPTCLHFVDGLVAIVPGIQVLVSGVIVDAAVAAVALWKEHHRTLIAVQEKKTKKIFS